MSESFLDRKTKNTRETSWAKGRRGWNEPVLTWTDAPFINHPKTKNVVDIKYECTETVPGSYNVSTENDAMKAFLELEMQATPLQNCYLPLHILDAVQNVFSTYKFALYMFPNKKNYAAL